MSEAMMELFEMVCGCCQARFYETPDRPRSAEICPYCGAHNEIEPTTNEWVSVEVVGPKKKRK
jgi:hypothetical protein